MSISGPTAARTLVPTDSPRRTALVAGVFYLLTFVSIPTWGQQSAMSALFALPIAVWEFSLGVYLIVRGFRPSPITAGMTGAGAS